MKIKKIIVLVLGLIFLISTQVYAETYKQPKTMYVNKTKISVYQIDDSNTGFKETGTKLLMGTKISVSASGKMYGMDYYTLADGSGFVRQGDVTDKKPTDEEIEEKKEEEILNSDRLYIQKATGLYDEDGNHIGDAKVGQVYYPTGKKKGSKIEVETADRKNKYWIEQTSTSTDNPNEDVDDSGTKNPETNKDTAIYKSPNRVDVGDSAEENVDDMVGDAEEFVNEGEKQYKDDALQNFSKTMYNILLSVGVAVAVIVGGILGITFMSSSVEGKAEVKKQMIAYLIGCIVVFGGFGIWKIIVNILENI